MAKRFKNPELNGFSHTKFWYAWVSMRSRCNNKNYFNYSRWGRRGITYPTRWKSFEVFYEDMYDSYSPELSLDRIDNDKNYSKENCRWATRKEQQNNTSRNKFFTIGETTQTLSQWAETADIGLSTIKQRFYTYGWNIEKALYTPVRIRK